MNDWLNSLTDSAIQCWGCAAFDRLFQIVSTAAAAVYESFSAICLVVFGVLFTVFVINAIYKNIKNYACVSKIFWINKNIKLDERPNVFRSRICLRKQNILDK